MTNSSGRVALVTGGTRGIGAAIALALAKADYRVAVNYHQNADAARGFAERNEIPVFKWDVSDYDSCCEGVAEVERAVGPIDVLVNNAGITRDGFLHKSDPQHWHAVIGANLNAVYFMTRCVITGMRQREFGRLITIASVNGLKGQLGQANYAAAKAGVIGFTKSVALESAAKGITANVVAPGYVATEMVSAIPEKVLQTRILPTIPVARLGDPAEVARCVVFLAHDAAGYITGETISVNGGQLMS